MRILRTAADVRRALAELRSSGATVGLVPTMGALHDGHLSLLRAARETCDTVVLSLFVNPAQFGQAEDLDRYPRDEAGDAEMAVAAGVDLLFAPATTEIYPDGYDTWVEPGKIGTFLEGVARPGHFRGVATVCVRLFNIVEPITKRIGVGDGIEVHRARSVGRFGVQPR